MNKSLQGTVKRWGINGEGIVYCNRKPVFVEGAIPDESVAYEITENHKGYAKGKLLKVLEASPRRRHVMCAHADKCGGCALMHVDYKGQIRMKESAIKEALKKYAFYTGPVLPMIKNPEPLAYRNACKLPFSLEEGKVTTGLYQNETTEFVPVSRCLVHQKKLEAVRSAISDAATSYNLPVHTQEQPGLVTLVLKEFDGKVHVVLVTDEIELPQEFIDEILHLENTGSVWQSVREEEDPDYALYGSKMLHLGGDMDIVLHLGDYTLNMLPRSFFQLNTLQAKALYELIQDWIPEHSSYLIEAYSGIGAISLYASQKADKITGIEEIEDAVINARQNALLNGCDNLEFLCGDAAAELKNLCKTEKPDTIIVDPPRSGLSDEMISAILKSEAKTLIYVSCNPSTLAKNLAVLQKKYAIRKVQPFDFFSQTPHVETAVLLTTASQKEIEDFEKKEAAAKQQTEKTSFPQKGTHKAGRSAPGKSRRPGHGNKAAGSRGRSSKSSGPKDSIRSKTY